MPASRNAPCPCGSGRRYKDCHGALPAAPAADPVAVRVAATLADALRHQKTGRLREAAHAYAQVLADAPDQFDALHMLGVVHFQLGEFDRALPLIARAHALRPDLAEPRKNLALVEGAIERRSAERELCRAVLPRLAGLCEPVTPGAAPGRVGRLSLVLPRVADAETIAAAARFATMAPSAALEVWREGGNRDGVPEAMTVRTLDPAAGLHPRGAMVVACGALPLLGGWLDAATPARVGWLVVRDEPGVALDRLRELSGEGRNRVALYYADAALAAAWPLPGVVLGPAPATTA